MDSAKLNDRMQVLGIFALVASLIFVGYQLLQDRRIAEVEALAANLVAEFELAQLIKDERDIWLKGLRGEKLSDSEELVFEALAKSLFRRAADSYRAGQRINVFSERIAQSFAYFVYQYPGLRRKVQERIDNQGMRDRAFGGSDDVKFFSKIVSDYLQYLDETEPETPSGNYLPL